MPQMSSPEMNKLTEIKWELVGLGSQKTAVRMMYLCAVCSHNSRGRLADLVAEHLDHMHYLNDILSLDISALNDVLTEHLLNRLLVPLYVFSLVDESHGLAESVCVACE